MKKKQFLSLTFCGIAFTLLSTTVFAQKSIADYIKFLPLDKCYSTDLPLTDTLIDVKNGYFEITNSGDPKNAIVQGAVFKNTDSTVTIAVTGLFQDQQCGFYHSTIYECSEKTTAVKEISSEKILPKMEVKQFLVHSKAPAIISAKLKSIKTKNPDKLTTEDAISEIYSLHYIIPRQGSQVIITPGICDYILTKIMFSKKDRETIATDFKNQTLNYDRKSKTFVLQK